MGKDIEPIVKEVIFTVLYRHAQCSVSAGDVSGTAQSMDIMHNVL